MILKNFYFNIILRLVLIVFTCILMLLVVQHFPEEYLFTLIGLLGIFVVQIIMLGRFVNGINQDLTRFLSAIRNEDSTLVFKEAYENKYFRDLYRSMNDLNEKIVTARAESQKQSLILNNIVNDIGIGLILYYDSGEVMVINHAAKNLLKVPVLNDISTLQNSHADLAGLIIKLKPGRPEMFRLVHQGKEQNEQGIVHQLLLKKDIIKTEDRTINTISIQNIVKEMERKELDSWQKLIRVLTHEIMNSVSPIISLTKSITKQYTDEEDNSPIKPDSITPQTVTKTISGLHTIRDTGEGLIDFVSKYRSLSRLPEPQFSSFKIADLFKRIEELMQEEIEQQKISLSIEITNDPLEIVADINQLEKVLINLIKNSVEALSGKDAGYIRLEATGEGDSMYIQVEDNGAGIPSDVLDDIFVPFFTTKSKGSGIGLSISKQIVLKHEGTISVHSIPGERTTFTLKF